MDPEVGDVPWPNPRNWVKASKKYESVIEDRGQPSIDKINRMFSGIVGTEAAIMFCEFLKIKNVFNQSDVEMVYTDPENAKLLEGDTMVLKNEKGENTNVDVTFAVMVYIAYYKNKEKVTTTEIYNLLTYSMRYSNSDNCNVLVVYFKNAHPCLNEDPELKKYWVNATKEWSVKYRSAYR